MSLTDSVIVITGASSGFGEAIARECARRGARVVLAARGAESLDRMAAELGRERVLAVPTDIIRDDDVARLARATFDRFGRADVLVNNAGFGILDRFVDAQLDDLQAMVDVNLYGAVRCTRAFLPHMLARHNGQLVMMASLAGLVSTANMPFYNATKAALVGLTRTLMLELEGTGVRCALICPGTAPTGFQRFSGYSRYARIARLSACTAEQVAATTVRAIERRTHGEVIVPRRVLLLTALAGVVPPLTRFVLRLVG